MPLRLKLLVVAHVLLSVLGIAQFRLLFDVLWLPLVTAISSLAFAQAMLVGLWIGLGSSRLWIRVLGWLAASVYLAVWPSLAIRWLPPGTIADDSSFENGFVPAAVLFAGTMALFATIYGVIRRHLAELRMASLDDNAMRRPQFAILHVMVVTTLVCLVLAMSRAVILSDIRSGWHSAALYALLITNFVVTVVAVPWAMLKPGRIWRRLLVVFLSSSATGFSVSFVFYYRMTPAEPWHWWWVFLGQAAAIGLVPMLVLVVSLAIVRGCGYRLVNKPRLPDSAEPLQFDLVPLNSQAEPQRMKSEG